MALFLKFLIHGETVEIAVCADTCRGGKLIVAVE